MTTTFDYEPGQIVPGTTYRVIRPLAAGGMGCVYEVADIIVEKPYVMKTLRGVLANDQDLAARVACEARTLGRLQHPHIVQVFTAGTTADHLGLPYIVMERLDGNTLRNLLCMRGAFDPKTAIEITLELLAALEFAHDKGVVHCDVKPENVFLHRPRNGGFQTKLLDFGVVRLAGEEQNGRFLGTFRYASPEQLTGKPIGPAADLYAVGLVLYEMLNGKGPFDAYAGANALARAHLHVIPAAPADIPPGLADVVMRALDKQPLNRPKDAFTFSRWLRALALKLRPTDETRIAPYAVQAAMARSSYATTRAAPYQAETVAHDTVKDDTWSISAVDLL